MLWVTGDPCKIAVNGFDSHTVHQIGKLKQMTDKKPFCIAPWVSLQYGSLLRNGGATPCCDWGTDAYKGKLADYFDSDWLNSVKQLMIDHDYDKLNQTCAACIESERVGCISIRQRLLDDATLNVENGLSIIDYRPDNICNLKCRMCSSNSSSLIAKENNEILEIHDTDDIFDLDYSTINHVKVVGGEPSISKKIHDFLKWLIDHGHNSHIELSVTTNATNANARWMNLIKQFKRCHAIISIDAIGPAYEYIRTNANWISIERNSAVYGINNIDTTFQITGSMYNIPVIEDWMGWFMERNSFLYPVEGREYLNMSALPDEIRYEKLRLLERIDHPIASVAYQMLSTASFDKTVWKQFVEYTNHLDRIRKTDIRKVSPIFERIMNYNG